MTLRNDFHVADAHTVAYQSLTQFVAFAKQIAANPDIKATIAHAPKKTTQGRGFLQLVLDDAMDSFASVMARTIHNSDVEFEDIPHEFYLKLMHDRHGGKITKQDALNTLKDQVDAKLKQQNIQNKSQLPTFIRLTMDEMEPQTLADMTNNWSAVVSNFATLLMSETGLAAKSAAIEITMSATMEAQQHINKTLKKQQAEKASKPGGGKSFKAAMAKLETMDLPTEIREKVNDEIDKLGTAAGGEESKIKEYLVWIAALPWNEFSKLEEDLNKTEKIMNADHYGLDKVKEAIIEHVAIENHTGGNSGRILCLAGPPGVGKTSIAASIAKATGREYARMSLGGIRDEAEIRGHGRTYVGSKPGRLMEVMKKAKKSNPLVVLDEIDKMGQNSNMGDPTSAMLEVLDPAQNSTFHDHFIELDYDLSKVMFIATANDLGAIPAPLRDRMDIIQIPGYTREEKLEIAKRHLVMKSMAANGLTDKDIEIKDNALTKLISEHTREAGVRGLERNINKICRKIVKKIVLDKQNPNTNKVTVTDKNLEDFVGTARITRMNVGAQENRVGLINALAYSTVGGSIMQIEATLRPSRQENANEQDFQLKVTGNLGKVMDESTEAALSASLDHIMSKMGKLTENNGYMIHVNTVEGSGPKDGPSAGAAITTAIVSLLTNIPIRSNVAMTGAISGNGDVMPIGGLPEKLDGAIQDGADTVLIPKENEADLADVPKSIRDKLNIKTVSTIEDVLKYALTAPIPSMKSGPGQQKKSKPSLSSTFPANDTHDTPAIKHKKANNLYQAKITEKFTLKF